MYMPICIAVLDNHVAQCTATCKTKTYFKKTAMVEGSFKKAIPKLRVGDQVWIQMVLERMCTL